MKIIERVIARIEEHRFSGSNDSSLVKSDKQASAKNHVIKPAEEIN